MVNIPLLLPMVILIGLGWVMVFSTSAMPTPGNVDGSVFYHLQRQVLATGLGAAALLAATRVSVAALERYALAALCATGALMLMVFIPGLGISVGGATRWLNVGIVSFQPVEMLKLAVMLGYAWLLSKERPREPWSRGTWVKIGGLAAVSVVLPILQRDYGSAVLMLGLGGVLVWLAGAQLRPLLGCAAIGMAAAASLLISAPYRIHRIKLYLSAWGSADGGGYQTKQSLIALGAGGLFGVGLGESGQKLFYLPLAHADFIYAIIGEELGFIGAFATLALYLLLLHQGLTIAGHALTRFTRLLAGGLALLIFSQAIWHIAVALVLVPTKGLVLPFVSYGGSSLVSSMLAVGLILRCADKLVEPAVTPGLAVSPGSRVWEGS